MGGILLSYTVPAAARLQEAPPPRSESRLRATRVAKGPGDPAVDSATATPPASRGGNPPAHLAACLLAGC